MSFGNNIPVDLRKWLSSLLSNYGGSQKDVLQKKKKWEGERGIQMCTLHPLPVYSSRECQRARWGKKITSEGMEAHHHLCEAHQKRRFPKSPSAELWQTSHKHIVIAWRRKMVRVGPTTVGSGGSKWVKSGTRRNSARRKPVGKSCGWVDDRIWES